MRVWRRGDDGSSHATSKLSLSNDSIRSNIRERGIRSEIFEREKNHAYGLSCLWRCRTIIKQHISTLLVPQLVVMPPKYIPLLHRAHGFIVNVQPSFSTAAVSVQHVNRIVSVACGLAVVVKHPIKIVARWICRFPGSRRQNI